MRNNATVCCLIAVLVCGSGCATLLLRQNRTQDRIQEGIRGGGKSYRLIPLRDADNPEIVYSYVTIEDESYFDVINREAKARRKPISPLSQKRHIGFFGFLKEFEKEVGVKVVFPF